MSEANAAVPPATPPRRGFRPRRAGEARPGRRAVVEADLATLHGPTSGVVELPHRLFWQPDRRIDLDRPGHLALMYELVLQEATTVDELRTWLDGRTLVDLWPRIFVRSGVRAAWELRHPQLRDTSAAAAA
jgi:hypothetical protein